MRAPGRLVLVGGDAGVGKTALVRRFCDECAGRARVLWGACDALFTPRPLGPLFDVAESVGGELEALVVAEGGPREVVAALRDELRTRSPTVLVLEDVHWADEATLDVVRLLARRLEAIPALVVATYRDDELESTHALRVVLGDLAAQRGVERIRLAPLSRAAVAALAATSGLDAAELHRVTGGNPFFVTEVLAAGGEEIPATVRDAVMARIARLSGAARRGLEALAIVPGEVELWLLEALAPEAGDWLDESLASGMLAAGRDAVSYRHELARLAVEEALAPNRAAGVAPPGARGAGGSARRSARSGAAGASRGGGGRPGRGAPLRSRGRGARVRAWRPPRGGRPVRPSVAVRRGPAAVSASRSAGAAVARVLSHRRLLGRDRGARGRPHLSSRARRRPGRGRRADRARKRALVPGPHRRGARVGRACGVAAAMPSARPRARVRVCGAGDSPQGCRGCRLHARVGASRDRARRRYRRPRAEPAREHHAARDGPAARGSPRPRTTRDVP